MTLDDLANFSITTHVVPVGDLREHDIVEPCWCHPTLDEEYNIWVHNSMDGREDYEAGRRKPH